MNTVPVLSRAVVIAALGVFVPDAAVMAHGGASRPVHTTLLAAGIPIVEHLRGLAALPDSGFRFSAVPVKVRGMGTFPVRACASVP